MARYRKLLIVSPIALVAILMALYGHQLDDWNPEQNQWVSVESGSEQAQQTQAGSQIIPLDDGGQEVPLTIEDESLTEVSQDISPTSQNITISGWVGTELGENIAFETVELFSPSQKTYRSIVTGPSGEFKFTDLKPGWDYVLNVSPQGMFKRYTKSQIKLRFDQEVHNIVLESIPLGVLSGRIVDPYDRPVTGITLLVQTVETVYWSRSVMTDANGSFSVAEFPKGRFQVVTEGQFFLTATGLNFDPVIAVPVTMTFDLGPYNLGGRIYDESGQTFDGAEVFLNWVLHESGVRIRSTRKARADANGEFRFTGLGPGEHELIVYAWRGSTFKQTVKRTVNVGVDSGELIIVLNTL
jgi:hypothetical protein